MKEQPKTEKTTLKEEELSLLSQILYRSQWNGEQWQQTITPLINKLAKMIDELKKPAKKAENK